MTIALKPRLREHVVTFWEKAQDEEIQKLFPFSTDSLEKVLQLFEASQEEGATSYGEVIFVDDKYVGDIWCYCIDESE